MVKNDVKAGHPSQAVNCVQANRGRRVRLDRKCTGPDVAGHELRSSGYRSLRGRLEAARCVLDRNRLACLNY